MLDERRYLWLGGNAKDDSSIIQRSHLSPSEMACSLCTHCPQKESPDADTVIGQAISMQRRG